MSRDVDVFESKTITPMLISENVAPFDSPDYWYELKLDGIRCLAYLDENGIELRNKRNDRLNGKYPELSGIHKQAKKRCILDGELAVIIDGRPNFAEIQRRSLMSDKFKIETAAKKYPVCFTAYDLLYAGNTPLINKPLTERVEMLYSLIAESPLLALSRHIEEAGIALFTTAKERGLEGVVAKRKDSRYYPGKRTKDWLKMKALLDDDFIVCGYYLKGNLSSVIIGACVDGSIVYQGHVVLGVSRQDFRIMSESPRADKSAYPSFPDFDGAVWLEPTLVCTVTYMERTKNGGLRQPVFKGLRDDKSPEECVLF